MMCEGRGKVRFHKVVDNSIPGGKHGVNLLPIQVVAKEKKIQLYRICHICDRQHSYMGNRLHIS
jgi:hypothetical protein